MSSICILTPTHAYEERWSPLRAQYLDLLGAETSFRDWTNPGDLSSFAIILPLIAWGYSRDYVRWFALLDRMERENLPVINPVNVLRWNSDKAYLVALNQMGVGTVPTIETPALALSDIAAARKKFGAETLIVKPPISGGADGTYRLTPNDSVPAQVLGARMMIQPFLDNISAEGEYSLFYFGGNFSHAILKHPAKGDFRVQDQHGGYEESITPPPQAFALAETAMAAAIHINVCAPLAYARVDMLRDGDGAFALMELELIEPALFMHQASDGGALFAQTIAARTHTAR